jgi:hypothetical protein
MHNLVQIESDNSLARDMSSHAVLTINPDKINDYYARKKIAEEKYNKLSRQQQEIDALKGDIKEIKTMLLALLQR